MVLNQTLENIEIIVVNDGSTDQSLKIIKKLEKKDNRIKVINQKNKGVSMARNIGIDASLGEYIGFVDIDDRVDLSMYEKLYNNAKYNNSDMHICGFYEIIGENINHIENPLGKYKKLEMDQIKKTYMDLIISDKDTALLSVWNKIYKSEFIKQNKIYFNQNRIIGEDRFFNIDVMLNAKVISAQNDKLYFYNRNNEQSVTNKYNKNTIGIYLEEKNDILDFIINNEEDFNKILYFKKNQYSKIFYQLIYYCMLEIRKDKTILYKFKAIKQILSQPVFKDSINIIDINSKSIKILIQLIKLKCIQ